MFDLTAPLVIAPDVEMVSAATLSDTARRRLGCEACDLLLSRQRSRSRTKVVAGEAVAFVRRFEQPITLTAAIRDAAAAGGRPAPALLELLFPLIAGLVNDGFLLPHDELPSAVRTPQFGSGRTVAGFEIVRCVQMYEDTELYQVRAEGRLAALKVARSAEPATTADLVREASIHQRLAGGVAPRLLARGDLDGRAFLAVEWRTGRNAAAAADAIRARGPDARPALLDLGIRILDAFAILHDRGLVHGDVHPDNIVVADDGTVTILDYGLARFVRDPQGLARPARGGVGFFLDPGYAAARLAGAVPPAATARSEQYSLGCLVWLLIAGRHCLDFSYDETTAYRQIRDEPPRAFAAAGAPPWPDLEAALAIALAKTPTRRFRSVAAFAERLRQIRADGPAPAMPDPAPALRLGRPVGAALDLLLSDMLTRIGPGAPLALEGLREAPTASVHSGAAGIAYALYRIACVREDAALLAAADLWSCRAMAARADQDAYFAPASDITAESVGRVSLVHSLTGTAYVHALIALACGNVVAAQRAFDAFVAAGGAPCDNPDVFLGRAGLLIACAALLDAASTADAALRTTAVAALGRRLAGDIGDHMAVQPPIGQGTAESVGMAHGWSGLIYALLRWSEAVGAPDPDGVPARLDQLAACARPEAAGVRWPIRIGRGPGGETPFEHMPGWCNGGAGHVHAFLLAFARHGLREHLDLAVRSATQAIADCGPKAAPFLCCGTTGVAYAALALFRATREPRWRDEAVRLAEAAAADIRSPRLPETSLFRGAVGTALLAADLARPEEAVMPVFGRET